MSKLLFDEQPIVIDRNLAKLIGLNESIVIQQIHYWIEVNKKSGKNLVDGKYWTYNSMTNWHEENFDFWSYDTVKRTFAKLEKMGLIISANHNKDQRDRTKWYTINYEKLEQLKEDQKVTQDNKKCIGAKCPNGRLVQNAPMEKGKLTQPLPENNLTEISTEINNNNTDEKAVVVSPELEKELREFVFQQNYIFDNEALYKTLLDYAKGDIERAKKGILATIEADKQGRCKDFISLAAAAILNNWKPNGEIQKTEDTYDQLYLS